MKEYQEQLNREFEEHFEALRLEKAIRRYISGLPGRTEDILVRRYGLDGGKKHTLEAIGDTYGITRERVRQIESAALRDLRKSDKVEHIKPAEKYIKVVIEDHGHIMEHDHLVDLVLSLLPHDEAHRNHVEFVLHVGEDFNIHSEDEHYKKSWHLPQADKKAPKEVLTSLIDALEEHNDVLQEDAVVEKLKKSELDVDSAEIRRILASLRIGKKVAQSPYGEWGLSHWTDVIPRGIKDKAYIVLKKAARPLHFTEITDLINEAGLTKKPAISQTVHNELIKDDRFVLVGRGIYALASWGFSPGTVADVVMQVLNEAEKPLSRDEIVKEVLKHRLVKRNTIVLALQNKEKIRRIDDKYVIE